jgi:hypothetical protein
MDPAATTEAGCSAIGDVFTSAAAFVPARRCCPKDTWLDFNATAEAMRTELARLPVWEQQRRAVAAGVGTRDLVGALNSADPTQAVIDLLVGGDDCAACPAWSGTAPGCCTSRAGGCTCGRGTYNAAEQGPVYCMVGDEAAASSEGGLRAASLPAAQRFLVRNRGGGVYWALSGGVVQVRARKRPRSLAPPSTRSLALPSTRPTM